MIHFSFEDPRSFLRLNYIGGDIMIWFYSGTPGSGKSLHVARDIFAKLLFKKEPVIASFPIDTDFISRNGKRQIGKFTYCDIMSMSPEFFIDYAMEHHVIGKEAQTLVVIDECQCIFNPREFTRKDRLKWIMFFTQHRRLGFNFVLISQFDRLVDRQIRSLFEYEVKHRKINNFKLGMLLPFKTFAAVSYWYGVRERIGVEFFIYRKKYGRIYDTFLSANGDSVRKFILGSGGGAEAGGTVPAVGPRPSAALPEAHLIM